METVCVKLNYYQSPIPVENTECHFVHDLIDPTWIYAKQLGIDAFNLKHKKIRVRNVYHNHTGAIKKPMNYLITWIIQKWNFSHLYRLQAQTTFCKKSTLLFCLHRERIGMQSGSTQISQIQLKGIRSSAINVTHNTSNSQHFR